MNFKKKYFWIALFLGGLLIIFKSVSLGRSSYIKFVAAKDLWNQGGLDVLLNNSILSFIVIGSFLCLLAIKQICNK